MQRIILFFFPEINLEGTSWKTLWDQEIYRERWRKSYLLLGITGAVLLAHHWLVDAFVNPVPAENWLWYRIGYGSLGIVLAAVVYLSQSRNSYIVSLPVLFYYIGLTALQTMTIHWDSRSPVLFTVLLPFMYLSLGAYSMRHALFFYACVVCSQMVIVSWYENDYVGSGAVLTSSYLVLFVAVLMTSNSYSQKLKNFILRQKYSEKQADLIKHQKSLNQYLRGFLSKEHYLRLKSLSSSGESILSSIEKVFRPEMKMIACIYSDVRNYTERSRNEDNLFINGVMPNISELTGIVDNNRGIPRLVGDLIFSYFDFNEHEHSLIYALRSAAMMKSRNIELNKKLGIKPIERNFVVCSGEAMVGNIGPREHAREITALGSCVNLGHRLDDYAKTNRSIPPSSIIVSSSVKEFLADRIDYHELEEISLQPNSVKDFPELTFIYVIPNEKTLDKAINDYIGGNTSVENRGSNAA